jgi:hypothetical protein
MQFFHIVYFFYAFISIEPVLSHLTLPVCLKSRQSLASHHPYPTKRGIPRPWVQLGVSYPAKPVPTGPTAGQPPRFARAERTFAGRKNENDFAPVILLSLAR